MNEAALSMVYTFDLKKSMSSRRSSDVGSAVASGFRKMHIPREL